MVTDYHLIPAIVNSLVAFWSKKWPKSCLLCKEIKVPGKYQNSHINYGTSDIAFTMFTHFLYEHMIIYTNLISNITEGQNKTKKKSQKRWKKGKK